MSQELKPASRIRDLAARIVALHDAHDVEWGYEHHASEPVREAIYEAEAELNDLQRADWERENPEEAAFRKRINPSRR